MRRATACDEPVKDRVNYRHNRRVEEHLGGVLRRNGMVEVKHAWRVVARGFGVDELNQHAHMP